MSVISRSRGFDQWVDDLVSFLYNMFDFQVEALLIDWNEKVIVQHAKFLFTMKPRPKLDGSKVGKV